MKPLKRVWNTILAMGRPVLLAILAVAVIAGLFTWRLGSLTPGLSQAEIDTYNASRSLTDLLDDSVNAPYRAAVFISTKILHHTVGLRLVGAAVGILSVVVFYLLARKLYRPMIAIATTGMFASTSLLLGVSRSATANVMLLSLLAIVAVGYLIRFERRQEVAWILAAAVIGLSLYVPGMAVFILLAGIWQFKHIRRSFESLAPTAIIISSVVLSLLAAPLVISLIRNPEIWRGLLGLPPQLASIADMAKMAGKSVAALFVMSPSNPSVWLGHQPVLDVFASILFGFGWWSLFKRFRLDRFWLLAGIFILTIVWIGIATNIMYLVVLLPFIYFVVGSGLHLLLSQWQSVFPRNPIARGVGLGLVLVAVLLAVNFQLQRYFVAWAHNADTKAVFSEQLPE